MLLANVENGGFNACNPPSTSLKFIPVMTMAHVYILSTALMQTPQAPGERQKECFS